MKLLIHTTSEDLFCMANLVPKRTGLSATIFSEHSGIQRNIPHNIPRAKISTTDSEVSVSIESNPKILAGEESVEGSDRKAIKESIEYVGRNSDLFLRHFEDIDDSFDDLDLFNALIERGEFR